MIYLSHLKPGMLLIVDRPALAFIFDENIELYRNKDRAERKVIKINSGDVCMFVQSFVDENEYDHVVLLHSSGEQIVWSAHLLNSFYIKN